MKKQITFGLLAAVLLLTSSTALAAPDSIRTNDSQRVVGRVAQWWGKVNMHEENGVWTTELSNPTGASMDILDLCKKWYPSTTSFTESTAALGMTSPQEITGWRDAHTETIYTSVKPVFACLSQTGTNTTTTTATATTTSTPSRPSPDQRPTTTTTTTTQSSRPTSTKSLITTIQNIGRDQTRLKNPTTTTTTTTATAIQSYNPKSDELGFIAKWPGKVSQYSKDGMDWNTDPEGNKGAETSLVAYCKKFWPRTKDVRIKNLYEEVDHWMTYGNAEDFGTSIKPSFACIK